MGRRLVLPLVLLLACLAPRAVAGEDKASFQWRLGVQGWGGLVPMEVDYLEAHYKRPQEPEWVDPSFFEPTTDREANDGIRYFATHARVGPTLQVSYGPHLRALASVGLLSTTLTTDYEENVTVAHPPEVTFLDQESTESTRLDEGVDFLLGGALHLEAAKNFALTFSYSLAFGVSTLSAGTFLFTDMEGSYSFFLHRLQLGARWRIPVEDVGAIIPRLGLGGVIYRSKAEFEQRYGNEGWRVEWIQERGYAVHLGLAFEAGPLLAGIDVNFFGERSVALSLALAL